MIVCRNHRSRISLAFLLASTALCASPALAQSANSASDATQVGDIIVTAQKREERASETPLSLSVLTGEALQAAGATQLADFAATVPSLSFTSNGVGQGQVNLRGVTTGLNVGSTVGIYVDEVPYGSSTSFAGAAQLALDVGLFDLDRVEVLRGPQGTLYGASTMGGLLKYVTKAPDPTRFGGGLRAGVSTTAHGGIGYDLAAAVNAPFAGDTAAVRLNGFYTEDGGFVDNRLSGVEDVNQSKVYGGRGDLLFNPTDALSIRLTGFAQEIERDGSGSVDFIGATGRPVDSEYDQRRFDEPFAQSFRLASAVIDYDFGPVQLTSITSYQTSDVDYVTDVSALYVPLLGGFGLALGSTPLVKAVNTDKFTQEARLAGSVGAFDWIVGGFYTREKSFQLQTLPATDPTGAPFPLNLLTAELPSLYEETAAFGTLTWHVTDRLDLSGGLRYATNDQTYEQNASGLLGGPAPKRSSNENVTTYLANARYRLTDRSIGYLRYATGYRPGGPNMVLNDPVTGNPLAPPTFDSDSLESYEAGYKASTADGRFSVDAGVYYIDWQDLQIVALRNGVGVVANASSAAIKGAELTVTARPTSALSLVAAASFLDAELDADSPDLGGLKGDTLPDSPNVTVALSADYGFSLGGYDADVGATVRYVDDRVSSFDLSAGTPQHALPDYTTVDLRAGIDLNGVRAQVYVRNLFDEFGELSATTSFSVAGGPIQITPLRPRTVGLTLTKRF
ncbi:TonB-dependent receptor [Brevundimonas sp. G8]|uniref:TonB-dependent receptor n=1 Tax=Brevundimonas sp. G8 TaxID=1350776 RepID=UPI0012F10776|nr:TonB-dependent receptor [Brevundimonas sp. G8]VXB62673.1 TonB-dependent receptor [Brevundimonas sp. G8]